MQSGHDGQALKLEWNPAGSDLVVDDVLMTDDRLSLGDPGSAFAAEAQKALTEEDVLSISAVFFKADFTFGSASRSDLAVVERVTAGDRRIFDVTVRILQLPIKRVVLNGSVTVILDTDFRAQPLAESIVPAGDLGIGDTQSSHARLLSRVAHNIIFVIHLT